MILFLDFDGTTHPYGFGLEGDFCCLPRIEKVLREFPHVQVVISSWWRNGRTLTQLREFFSEDIRQRVIGSTSIQKVAAYGSDSGILTGAQERGEEVLQWIADAEYTGPWVALDDDYRGFPTDCEQLIRCDSSVGVDAEIEQELRDYFNRYLTEKSG